MQSSAKGQASWSYMSSSGKPFVKLEEGLCATTGEADYSTTWITAQSSLAPSPVLLQLDTGKSHTA